MAGGLLHLTAEKLVHSLTVTVNAKMYVHVFPCVALILISIPLTQSCCAPSVFQGTAMTYGLISEGKTAFQVRIYVYE